MRSNLRFFSSMLVRARCLPFRAQICLYGNLPSIFCSPPGCLVRRRREGEGYIRNPRIRSLFSPVTIKPHPRENARKRKLTVWVFVYVGCFCTRRRVKRTDERIKTNCARVWIIFILRFFALMRCQQKAKKQRNLLLFFGGCCFLDDDAREQRERERDEKKEKVLSLKKLLY